MCINHKSSILNILVMLSIILISSCTDVRESIIPSKRAPDEFSVYTRAPLKIPPEYQLRVPEPGAQRPGELSPRETVETALLGSSQNPDLQNEKNSNLSPGVQSLLRTTGALNANPNIRSIINQETSILAEEDSTVIQKILFWNTASEYGLIVDPQAETKRIQESQALGQPLDNGEVPTIAKKKQGILEDIF